jgi:hypothetical protein
MIIREDDFEKLGKIEKKWPKRPEHWIKRQNLRYTAGYSRPKEAKESMRKGFCFCLLLYGFVHSSRPIKLTIIYLAQGLC